MSSAIPLVRFLIMTLLFYAVPSRLFCVLVSFAPFYHNVYLFAGGIAGIERDGIACTSKLEQTLFDDMNGTIRSTTGWGWSGATPPPRQTRSQVDCAA